MERKKLKKKYGEHFFLSDVYQTIDKDIKKTETYYNKSMLEVS